MATKATTKKTTTKKETTEQVVKPVAEVFVEPVEETVTVNSEVEALKQQMEELKALIAQQASLLQAQQVASTQAPVAPTVILQNNQRYIKVTSMVEGLVNLATDRYGKDKVFKIERMFDVIQVLDSDLRRVIDNHRRLVDDGIIYILDDAFIDEKGLRPNFENKITPDELKTFYAYADEYECVDIFLKATRLQKESMFIKLCNDYKQRNISASLAEKIGKIMNKNIFDIVGKSETYQDIYKQDKEVQSREVHRRSI